jgi:hypothetical protein
VGKQGSSSSISRKLFGPSNIYEDKNDGCTKEEEGKVSRHNLLNFVEEIDCAIVHIHTQHVDKHQDKRLTGS